jgi:hypothetical protein
MLLLRRVCAVSLLRRVGALVLLLQRVFAASLLRRLVFAVSLLLLSTLGCAQLEVHDGTSASCGTCHRAQAEAWRTSAHANSGTSRVFTALLPRVEASWGRTPSSAARAVTSPSATAKTATERWWSTSPPPSPRAPTGPRVHLTP